MQRKVASEHIVPIDRLREPSRFGILHEKDGLPMPNISSSEFKCQLGEYLAMTRDGPIMVEKPGKPVPVVLLPVGFEHSSLLRTCTGSHEPKR